MKTSLQRRPLLEVLKESELDIFWLEGRFVAQIPSPLLLLERDHVAAVIAVAVVLEVDAAAAGAVGVVGGARGRAERPPGFVLVLAMGNGITFGTEEPVGRDEMDKLVLPPASSSSPQLDCVESREPAALRVLLACLHAWLGCLARGLLW